MPDSDHVIAQSHIELEKRIRERAHQIWLSHHHGKDRGEHGAVEDWLQAEREVLGNDPKYSAQNRGTTVGDAHTPDRSRMTGTAVADSAEVPPPAAPRKTKGATAAKASGGKTRGATAWNPQDPDLKG